MCGIVGVFSTGTQLNTDEYSWKAERMLSRISHRGFLSFKKVETFDSFSLGCVRLPIVDEANGTQPFMSSNERIALVFNGEIYNYLYLKDKYLSDMPLRTESDMEVLANLIEVYGIETALSLLEGMFAFIAYDFPGNKFYVARDIMGIKPVYISESSSEVLIASEMKAFDKECDNIQEIPPQHYYDSAAGLKKWVARAVTTGKKLRELVSASVKEQVQTALPVAVLLSGGIDSSIICFEANRHHPDVTAFSIGREDSEDMLTAKRFCKEYNFKFQPIVVNESEVLNAIEDTVLCIESFEPNHIRAGTLSYLISRHIAALGYRVALCGEGADELFAGYPDFIELLRANGNDYEKLEAVLKTFVDQLYLTQLKRVDRTGMRFALEVRPPFLSSDIVAFAGDMPASQKLISEEGKYITKQPLREAYRGGLPDYIVDRTKSVFTEGAGFDTNTQKGPFWEYAKNKVSESEIGYIQKAHPGLFIKTPEEAYYFNIYRKYFDIDKIKPKRLTMSAL